MRTPAVGRVASRVPTTPVAGIEKPFSRSARRSVVESGGHDVRLTRRGYEELVRLTDGIGEFPEAARSA